ncbi:MAG: hypothetical protein K2X66_14970 [Cyanobacteria bacterium]|nr:hypothetical protein [Cyanobacteriota bacterium]
MNNTAIPINFGVLKIFIIIITLCLFLAQGHPPLFAQGKSKVSGICPEFQSVFPVLKKLKKANITIEPVMSKIWGEDPLQEGLLIESSPNKVCNITLINAPRCPGATACSSGHYRSVKGGSLKNELLDNVQKVQLLKGITGYYYDATRYCATGCDSSITWQQGQTIYTVGRKYDTLDHVKKMANQVIAGSP